MKKAIVLIGPEKSGKSRLSTLFINGKSAVIYDGKKKIKIDSFRFKECTKNTEFVVFDDFNLRKNELLNFYEEIVNGIQITTDVEWLRYKIHPQFIFTIDGSIKDIPQDLSFESRFDVFELKSCNKKILKS